MNQKRRSGRTRALGEFVPLCLGEALAAQGFADAEIVTRWADIAGEDLARRSRPMKLAFPRGRKVEGEGRRPAVLTVEVEGAFALDLQMQAPVVIERINRYFGWRAVAEIRLKQTGRLNRPAPARREYVPDAAAIGRVAPKAEGFEDARLADAMMRLGLAVASAARDVRER